MSEKTKGKKVLVLSCVGRQAAAIRYRVLNTLDVLQKLGKVEYDFYSVYSDKTMVLMDGGKEFAKALSLLRDILYFCTRLILLACSDKYSTVLVKNSVWPLGMALSERLIHLLFHGKRFIYDIDDAIYFNQSRQKKIFSIMRRNDKKVGYWVQHAEKVIISNEIIYDDLRQMFGLDKRKCIFYLSAPFQEQYFKSSEELLVAKTHNEVRIIWLGSPFTQDNLCVMQGLIEALPQVIPGARVILMGCSDSFKFFRDLPYVEFVDWSIENEIREMRLANFGLNPLENDKFQRRKSAFKVIQYYRAGVIPIASDVGINKSLIETYGGYCSKDFSDIESMLNFITEKQSDFITESEMVYHRSQELSVESNAIKLERIL